ncbi:ATP/GTP-binding protein [Spiractinospora alimapuensis]|uniref:GTP-binding protein n=1 Tax=Spiractinospora alimapuensis TaxID=2820884 RepID=UPI001F486C03|nr:ATP/GTP-binding protein [Spiractinospora alimapuensis]QVQ52545.1 ATP/GTP-binding protein [Spiractinospora alimapuensis]
MPQPSDTVPDAVKIVVAGGFGAGKTTLVAALSEIQSLHTEELIGPHGGDLLSQADGKTTTTVALDFGRVTLDERTIIYLFGAPGQDRFSFMWDDLARGALGAIVLVDTRRLEECFSTIDYFEGRGVPFIVAVNVFADAKTFPAADVRGALAVDPDVPVTLCDARDRTSVNRAVVELVSHVLERELAGA